MAPFNFIGGSYTLRSVNAECQECINLVPETIETGMGKSRAMLSLVPGKTAFSTLPGSKVRGQHTAVTSGRHFAVSDGSLYEIMSNGSQAIRGAVTNDGLPVSFASGLNEMVIASGGTLYLYVFATNALSVIADPTNVSQVGYLNGYFIATLRDSQNIRWSALLNGASWSGSDVAQISRFTDAIVSFVVTNEELWFFGGTKSLVYYNSGSPQVFEPIPNSLIEHGSAAVYAAAKLDNTIFLLGKDADGQGIVWRMQGYTPTRVSTHAVEQAIAGYSTLSDAVAYTMQMDGRSEYHLYFPTANVTWVYDVATGLWHKRLRWKPATATYEADHACNHIFVFGKHLVGDWASGKIFELSSSVYTDDGHAIRWVRRAPHISQENERMSHFALELICETGVAGQPALVDGDGNPRGPYVNLRWSDDYGHTFSNEYSRDCGTSGNFKKRVVWRRLGCPRDRVFEMNGSDAVAWRLIDAYLKAS